MLTNASVKAAAPRSRAYKRFDGRGLFLLVTPAGARSWRMKYRSGGKEQLLTFGLYPGVSLADARARCDHAHAAIAAGEDPRCDNSISHNGRREKQLSIEVSFGAVARAWHAHRQARWTPVHAADVLASLERHVFPELGAQRITDIDVAAVLELLQSIESTGAVETARRIRQRISAVFKFAIVRELAQRNPAAELASELEAAPLVRHHAALTDIGDVRALYAAIDEIEAPAAVVIAHQLLALTGVRLAAVRGARWSEFENLFGSAPIWRVPAERMKLKRVKKLDAANDHIVPLAPAAVALLTVMQNHPLSCKAVREDSSPYKVARDCVNHDALVFPGCRRGKPIGEGAIGALIKRTSFAGAHVPHGWRSSFSTIMNELRPADRVGIDLALAHEPKTVEGKIDKVEGAYNRAQHVELRRRLLCAWADLLTTD